MASGTRYDRRRARPGRRRTAVAAVLAVAALALASGLVLGGAADRQLVPGAGSGDDVFDPLAYRAALSHDFERRAAAGLSHVLYAKSPGGARATARRTVAWRPQVEPVAARFGLDPALLEAIVFLESAGRPDARAGPRLESAAGLTQILAETAVDLLGMRVDLTASRRLTSAIESAGRRGKRAAVRRLTAARMRVDERFDPQQALAGTGRYLQLARARFGRTDLAVASYHMGIGNLESALRAHAGTDDDPIGEVVARQDLSYARLFFDSTPLLHPAAHARLARLGDDSATYLWRVLAASEILRLYRRDPAALARLEAAHAAKASAEEVLHPPGSTAVFGGPADVDRARGAGDLVALAPSLAGRHVSVAPRMGEFAERLGASPQTYRALRPEALAVLAYIGLGVEAVSGAEPLTVTSAVRDRRYQRLVARSNDAATRGYSLHTTGYAFDILRTYRSRAQASAFQFWLDRLQALNLIAWVREPHAIHVTVSAQARPLVPLLVEGR